MSWIQSFFTTIFPKSWAESMERDSRAWYMKCLKCNFERSYWDMGGIRWKAKGDQRNYQHCSNCQERSWHKSYKKDVAVNKID
jgi:hypothetical protein